MTPPYFTRLVTHTAYIISTIKAKLRPSFPFNPPGSHHIMWPLALVVFVILAVFGSLSAAQKRPSKHCEEVIQTYGPQCGVQVTSDKCKKFFVDSKHAQCYTEFLVSFKFPK